MGHEDKTDSMCSWKESLILMFSYSVEHMEVVNSGIGEVLRNSVFLIPGEIFVSLDKSQESFT